MGGFYVMVKEQSPWLPDPFVFIFALKTALRESCYSFIQVQCKLFIASFRVQHSGVPLSKKTSEKIERGIKKKISLNKKTIMKILSIKCPSN